MEAVLLLVTLLVLGQAEAAVWADEIETEPDSDLVIYPETSTTAPDITQTISNETRQLEGIAFPVGIAIGAIGAAIWPSIFPESTTATTVSSGSSSSSDASADVIPAASGDISATTASTTTTEKTSTTTFAPRTLLENFPDCGVKGSSNRVVGGTEVRLKLIMIGKTAVVMLMCIV